MPQAFERLFQLLKGIAEADQLFIGLAKVSYVQIYNEDVFDLLQKDKAKAKKELEIREHPKRGFYVDGMTSKVVTSAQGCMKFLEMGKKGRHTASTAMNRTSSRSHAIFSVTVECGKQGKGKTKCVRQGTIHMVDLAGSEDVRKSEVGGKGLSEAAHINKSLHHLTAVIKALTAKPREKHIPYRNSSLTKILAEAIGGNAKCAMIAAISPLEENNEV